VEYRLVDPANRPELLRTGRLESVVDLVAEATAR
jgi:hypothetical protein